MPQIFQVLRCYKCSIFQVHQTKKNNKWKCKVCGENQSVKRHYGIGIAKDCRVHVQKLNNMRGDMEELIQKADSDSEYEDEDNTENVDIIKINNAEVLTNNAKKESKWSAYVEKQEIAAVKEPGYINVEMCLELPQKHKINRKSKPFKVPKVSTNKDCNKNPSNPKIVNESNNNFQCLNSEELNNFNHKDNLSDLYNERSVKKPFETNRKKWEVMNKCTNFQSNKASKWAQYEENGDIDDNQYGVIENDVNCTEENKYIECYDENVECNYQKEQDKVYYDNFDQQHIENHCKESKNDVPLIAFKPIFSLCDDSDLENILDF